MLAFAASNLLGPPSIQKGHIDLITSIAHYGVENTPFRPDARLPDFQCPRRWLSCRVTAVGPGHPQIGWPPAPIAIYDSTLI